MAKKKVLVVEDDRSLAEVLQYNLEQAGYEVICSHDGQDGLNQARLKLPSLIVLDVMVPVMDGLEVCRRLRAITGNQQRPDHHVDRQSRRV